MNHYTSLAQIQSDLSSSKISVSTIVSDYLSAIESSRDLNAFLEVFAEESKVQANAVDEKIKAGTAGKLAG
ncbi:MAG: Asp-tRNA(Asn)/Glu-tRNA(Gln) amidotransferase subunit GatA, partial [Bacteroidota bacterium]